MADKKTGSARRPSRDEDEAPKKKQSGTQKSLKKSTSARKAASDDDDDDAPPAKPTKKGSARSSARGDSARGDSARGEAPAKRGPDKGKIFLYFVPGVMAILLGVGFYLYNLPDAKPPENTTINFDSKIADAKKKLASATALAKEGCDKEGEAGVPKLAEAYKLCCESHRIIQGVRTELKNLENSKDPNVQLKAGSTSGDEKKATSVGYAFEEDDGKINQLKIMIRKQLAERPGGIESIKTYVAQDQADEAASGKDDDLLK